MLLDLKARALTVVGLACVFSGCRCSRGLPSGRADGGPWADAALRIAVPEELAPLGRAPDGRETDARIGWIYLLTDPSPTGAAPYAAVGVRMPCGYALRYVTAERGEGEVGLRVRARWSGPGEPPSVDPLPCEGGETTVQLVSLSLLRVGTWRVLDVTARGRDGGVGVVQRVVADDAMIPTVIARWSRGCARDVDCASAGGECVSIAGAGVCAPREDPWLSLGGHCAPGLVPIEGLQGARRLRLCSPGCVHGGCPATHRCVAEAVAQGVAGGGACVPLGR